MNGRPLGRRLAEVVATVLVPTGVGPNLVTGLALITGLVAAGLYSQGRPAAMNVGALLFMVAVFGHRLDGALARASGWKSSFGRYFGHASAGITYNAFFTALGIALRDGTLGRWAIVLGVTAALCTTTIIILRILVERRDRAAGQLRTDSGFWAEDALYLIGPATWLGLTESLLVVSSAAAAALLAWVAWISWRTLSEPPRRRVGP